MADLIVCSAAERDYTDALRWYTQRSSDAANEFDAEFDRALKVIAEDPHRFPLCDRRHRFYLMRRFPFQIIYRSVEARVMIIAIAHTSRSPEFWAGR